MKGPCQASLQAGRLSVACPCKLGRALGPFSPNEDPDCEDCNHPLSDHSPYLSEQLMEAEALPPQNPPSVSKHEVLAFAFSATTCRREQTVRNLSKMLMEYKVIHVRGTPTSGKTYLARLLFEHMKEQQQSLKPIFITWRDNANAVEASCYTKIHTLSDGAVGADFFTRKDVVLIVDEAQLSYVQTDFWMECIKTQSLATEGPCIVLFSSYGSADSVALRIEGSAPITLEPCQRVSLVWQYKQPHDVNLCFTLEEFQDVCARHTLGQFTIDDDVKDRIYDITSGHPGLTHGILSAMLDLKVRLLLARSEMS